MQWADLSNQLMEIADLASEMQDALSATVESAELVPDLSQDAEEIYSRREIWPVHCFAAINDLPATELLLRGPQQPRESSRRDGDRVSIGQFKDNEAC